ncbi:hypothetical protein FPV67DRAFT_1672032 [Lyophyllum atratum]|nr:hypothetical protein FPV67DRAFT_1672032 [Lyophyllum atratum]
MSLSTQKYSVNSQKTQPLVVTVQRKRLATPFRTSPSRWLIPYREYLPGLPSNSRRTRAYRFKHDITSQKPTQCNGTNPSLHHTPSVGAGRNTMGARNTHGPTHPCPIPFSHWYIFPFTSVFSCCGSTERFFCVHLTRLDLSLSSYPPASLSTSVVSAAPAPPVHGPIPTPLLKPKEAVAWRRLIVRYTEEWLLKHQWKWIPESECWLPVYEYATMKKVTDVVTTDSLSATKPFSKPHTDIWAEHAEGLNGQLSVRELDEGWGAKWIGNVKALKSEATRRNKVVDLVQQLSKKPNGDVALALRFLCEHYEHLTSRAFTNLLGWNKNQGFTDILKAAEVYP